MNLFILPGNPPIRHFYQIWKDEILSQKTNLQIEIATYPHLKDVGHSKEYFEKTIASISNQIIDFQNRSKTPIALVGHSLGGFLALQVLEKNPNLVEKCFFIHPFLRRPSHSGLALLSLARALRRNQKIEKLLLHLQPQISKWMPEAAALNAEEISIFLHFAFHEYEVIGKDTSPITLNPKWLHKIFIYTTDDDIWCPESVRRQFETLATHTKGPASHAFIVHQEERKLLTDFLFSKN